MADVDGPPPRARPRLSDARSSQSSLQSRSQSVSDRVTQNPLKFLTEIYRPREPNDGIRTYYQKLIRGAEEEVVDFPPAFVSMAGGTIRDVFKDATDCLVCMAQSIKNKTVNGLCTRPRKRQNGTTCYPMFWDMDIYSPKMCTPEDFQFMMSDFLCPTMANFLDDDVHRASMEKTHFAVYYSQEEGSTHIAQQTKSKLVCGMCGKGALYQSIENMDPYAECKLCGVRFACSDATGGADTISVTPFMFSKPHFIKAHRSRMPFAQPNNLEAPEPWTRVDDANWDPTRSVISFDHGALNVQTQLRFFTAHIDKTSYKCGVHVKALNVEWLARKRRANIGLNRNLTAYLANRTRKPTTARQGALMYLTKVKKIIETKNRENRTHMTPAAIQTRAMAQLPTVFLTEQAHGASPEVAALDHYVSSSVDTLIFTPATANLICDYLATKAIQWQEALSADHFWKDINMSEAFDKAVYASGLRVPYSPKIMTCKHVRHRDGPDNSANCLRCDGTGKYSETARPPYCLQMVVDSKGVTHEALTKYLCTNIAGQLALTTIRVPIMGSFQGTVVRETGHMRVQMSNIPRTTHTVRSGIPENQSVQTDPGGSWQSYLCTSTEIDRRDILDPLQDWIRQLRPEWSGLRINQLKKKRTQGRSDRLPEYWVKLDSRSEGVHNCPYHHGDHTGGTIYFLIQPPKSKTEVTKMHGKILYYCWSGGCPGRNCTMTSRQKAHLPDGLVRRIWDPTSFVSSGGRMGDLGATLAAISRRRVAGRDARTDEIRRLVGNTGHLNNGTASSSGSSSSSGLPPSFYGENEPIPGAELILGTPPSTSATTMNGEGGGGSDGLSADLFETEPGQQVPTLENVHIARAYEAMSGALLVSCHAQMYKQFGKQCRPTPKFADVFTLMNQ
jgi:hypothetical protein